MNEYIFSNVTIFWLFYSCELPKKDLEETQDTSEKGPDIIPMSKDSEGKIYFLSLRIHSISEMPFFKICLFLP